MGGGVSSGDQTGRFMQYLQAQDARDRENLRQQRIKEGRGIIDRQFSQLMNPNDTFYARYKSGARDAYLPQIQRQYADANKELTYRLADAGTLRSSAAADATADLVRQNDAAVAGLNAKIDNAAAGLRTRVAGDKQNAENQLYATNDPDMALTQSLNSIQNIPLAPPDLSGSMANLFNVGTSGMANALKAMQNGGGSGFMGGVPTTAGFGNSARDIG
jgi:hypothetical protein